LQLNDPTGTAFNSAALPNVPPSLASFGGPKQINIFFSGGDFGGTGFVLTSLTLAPTSVPEPSSLLLIVTGLVAMALMHRTILRGKE